MDRRLWSGAGEFVVFLSDPGLIFRLVLIESLTARLLGFFSRFTLQSA